MHRTNRDRTRCVTMCEPEVPADELQNERRQLTHSTSVSAAEMPQYAQPPGFARSVLGSSSESSASEAASPTSLGAAEPTVLGT